MIQISLQTIFGFDILQKTPDKVLVQVYCLDEKLIQEALSPITGTVIIGPPPLIAENRQESSEIYERNLTPDNYCHACKENK